MGDARGLRVLPVRAFPGAADDAPGVGHGVFTGEGGRKRGVFNHPDDALPELPEFLDFLGFSGAILPAHHAFLRMPNDIFFSNSYNLMYLIHVKESTGAAVAF